MTRGGNAQQRRRDRRAADRAAAGVDNAPTDTLTASAVELTEAESAEIASLAWLKVMPDEEIPDDDEDAAMSGKCSDCGHMAMKHAGGDNAGACSMDGCSCGGFETAAIVAAAGDPVWVPDDGFQSIVSSIGRTLNTSGAYRWWVLDVALAADKALICDQDEGNSWIAPFTTTDGSVELAATTSWTRAEQEWVESADEYARINWDVTFDVPMVADGALAPELPDEHQPGERKPRRRFGPKAPESLIPDRNAALRWTATLAPEGRATDDGRVFAPGSITWRELPLTLMAMTKTADGHDGAEVAGRIDRIWREDNMIRAAGEFDKGDFGAKIAQLVTDGTLRGVSVDLAPQKVDMEYRSNVVDDDGNWRDDAPEDSESPSMVDLLLGENEDPIIYVVREAVLGMATVCPFQAFSDATIESDASLSAAASPMVWTVTSQAGWVVTAVPDTLTASGLVGPVGSTGETGPTGVPSMTASAAGLAPEKPPADWFMDPKFEELTALTIDDDGYVFGHAAAWATCHIGLPGGCRTAPHSNTNYAYFHLKEVECDDGTRVDCGTITLDTSHAQQDMSRTDASSHYDHTGTAIADVIVGEDDHGIWVSGALRADADAEKARKLRGAVLSGDWRNVNGNLELVALLAVNVPGFPVPRTKAALVASADDSMWEAQSLVAAGIHTGLEGLTPTEKAQIEALAAFARGDFDEFAAA